jgi:hypothetical protein
VIATVAAVPKVDSPLAVDIPKDVWGKCIASIGGERDALGLAQPMTATPEHVFAPRGACLHPKDGSLWVCDTGHHRLMGWSKPIENSAASWLVGQPDFRQEGRNAGGLATAATLNVPTGIAPCGDGLVVADAWNHRVLIWKNCPTTINQPADIVLGQADFTSELPNRGIAAPTASTMHWPFGVLVHDGHLYVADTGNRRVLVWDALPERSGQPADRVLGQPDFQSRNENGGSAVDAAGMRWPHAMAIWNDKLCVADAGNNRIMVYKDSLPKTADACDVVLGQGDFNSGAHTRGRIGTGADALNMPYGLAVWGDWLITTDTASSRLLGWHSAALGTGAAATALSGQKNFHAQGDNQWGDVTESCLSWPYGVSIAGNLLVTADTGNSRVMIHEIAL